MTGSASVPGTIVHPGRGLLGTVADEQRLAVSTSLDQARPAIGVIGGTLEALAVLVFVEVVNLLGLRVVPADADVVGLQHLAQLVADEIDDRPGNRARASHPLLDAVDAPRARRALLGLLEQALRLVEAVARSRALRSGSRRPYVMQAHVRVARTRALRS